MAYKIISKINQKYKHFKKYSMCTKSSFISKIWQTVWVINSFNWKVHLFCTFACQLLLNEHANLIVCLKIFFFVSFKKQLENTSITSQIRCYIWLNIIHVYIFVNQKPMHLLRNSSLELAYRLKKRMFYIA